jgi:hypothetical protein
MASAIQLGLVPGFALQDGDLLAALLSGEAGAVAPGAMFGLGSTTNPAVSGAGTGNNNSATAAMFASSINVLTTVTPTQNSFALAPIQAGTAIRVYNTTSNLAYVFPPNSAMSIDGNPPGQSVPLSGDARCDYLYLGNNAWVSDLLGTSSA